MSYHNLFFSERGITKADFRRNLQEGMAFYQYLQTAGKSKACTIYSGFISASDMSVSEMKEAYTDFVLSSSDSKSKAWKD